MNGLECLISSLKYLNNEYSTLTMNIPGLNIGLYVKIAAGYSFGIMALCFKDSETG